MWSRNHCQLSARGLKCFKIRLDYIVHDKPQNCPKRLWQRQFTWYLPQNGPFILSLWPINWAISQNLTKTEQSPTLTPTLALTLFWGFSTTISDHVIVTCRIRRFQIVKQAVKQAVLEQQNDSAPLNSSKLESEVMEEVKSEYDIYKENSFWIYHIGPEITLTILAVLLWVSYKELLCWWRFWLFFVTIILYLPAQSPCINLT